MDAGAYDHDTACKEALKALRKELKQRGKIWILNLKIWNTPKPTSL
jgi:hypothetical protein